MQDLKFIKVVDSEFSLKESFLSELDNVLEHFDYKVEFNRDTIRLINFD